MEAVIDFGEDENIEDTVLDEGELFSNQLSQHTHTHTHTHTQ